MGRVSLPVRQQSSSIRTIRGTSLGKDIKKYTFFSYAVAIAYKSTNHLDWYSLHHKYLHHKLNRPLYNHYSYMLSSNIYYLTIFMFIVSPIFQGR